jgi:hypothetical protein
VVSNDTPTTQALSVGSRVFVPWGLDVLEGVVANLQGDHVVVRLVVPGTSEDEQTTVVFPLSAIEPAQEARAKRPGMWLDGVRYQRGVADAIGRVLNEDATVITNFEDPHRRREADILVRIGDQVLVVETKVRMPPGWTPDALAQVEAVARAIDPRSKGLLVVPWDLPQDIQTLVRRTGLITPRLSAVRWRSAHDDSRLARVLRALIDSPSAA